MSLVPYHSASLLRRDNGGDDPDDNGNQTRTIISAVVVAAIGVIAILLGVLVYWRKKKSIDRHRRLASRDDSEMQVQQPESSTAPTAQRRTGSVNLAYRNSVKSILSIMTLPPYKETPDETEEVIAREGERDGLDFIVEGPETAEEMEAARQEEVSAIYRVQQTRRRELEERAERQRARRSAAERQDYREVARLDRAAREARQRERNQSTTSVGQDSLASGNSNNGLGAVVDGHEPSSGALLAELQEIRSRGRRVSAVTYAELGVQRHDGSRLRATSIDDDSQPLLDSSALMGRVSNDGGRSTRSRASSNASNNNISPESSSNSNPIPNGQGSPLAHSITPGRSRSRSRASRNGVEEDARTLSIQLSEDGIPHEPPSYDDDMSVHAGDAPRYEDVVLDTPRQSVDIASVHRPDAGMHEEREGARPRVERTPSAASKAPSAIPLRLQTSNVTTPSIEIVNATPVGSRPATPSEAVERRERRER